MKSTVEQAMLFEEKAFLRIKLLSKGTHKLPV